MREEEKVTKDYYNKLAQQEENKLKLEVEKKKKLA